MDTFINLKSKQLQFLPQTTANDARFKQTILNDHDISMLQKMTTVAEKINGQLRDIIYISPPLLSGSWCDTIMTAHSI